MPTGLRESNLPSEPITDADMQIVDDMISRPSQVPSELTGRCVTIQGHGDYVGRQYQAVVTWVSLGLVCCKYRDPADNTKIRVSRFDRISGWPISDAERVNGFRLMTPELVLLLQEAQGKTGFIQHDAVMRQQKGQNMQTIELEGYGKHQGRVIQADVLSMDKDLIVVEVTGSDGKRGQRKFQRADGKMVGVKGNDGFLIPQQRLSELTKGKPAAAASTGNGKPAATRSVKEAATPDGKCLCGCETDVPRSSRFVPGHDAKAHSMIKRGLRGQLKPEEIKSEWVKDQIELQGGYNSQEAPKSARKGDGTTNGAVFERPDGTKLYGAAAQAAINRQRADGEIEAAKVANTSSNPPEPVAAASPA